MWENFNMPLTRTSDGRRRKFSMLVIAGVIIRPENVAGPIDAV